MTEESQNERGFNIVVAYDFTEQADLALAEALVLADLQPHAVLHVIGVLDKKQGLEHFGVKGDINLDSVEKLQHSMKDRVVSEIERIEPEDFFFFVHARIGHAANEIIGLADEVEAQLVVIGTHGRRGLTRMMVGSVAEQVMRAAHCPVLVMRPTTYDPADRPTIEPEPPSPEGAEEPHAVELDPIRFSYTRRHQVMPLRPKDWPLW
jgi:nucleotide-binding universal stress UspA family protein